MSLQEITFPVRFAGGIETKMDPKAVPSVRLLRLRNAIFTKAVSLVKRNGYESLGKAVLGTTAEYTHPRGLGVRGGDELLLFTEGSPYSYVEGARAWSPIADGAQSIRQSDRPLVKTTSAQTAADRAVCAGIALVAWEDSRGGVYFAVEGAGGRTIRPSTLASATGSRPRCVRSGGNLVLLWAESTLGFIKSLCVTTEAPHAYTPAVVVVDDAVVGFPNFDAAYVNDNNSDERSGAAFAWNSVAGVGVAWLTPDGSLGTLGGGWAGPLVLATSGALTAGPSIAVYGTLSRSSAEWGIAWAVGNAAFATIATSAPAGPDPIDLSFAATASNPGPNPIDRLVVGAREVGTAVLDVWCEDRASTVMNSLVTHSTVSHVGLWTAGTPATFRGATIGSHAWSDGPEGGDERGYVVLYHPAPIFAAYLAVRDDGVVVALTAPSNAGAEDPPGHQLPRVTDDDGDRVYEWAGVYRVKLPTVEGVNSSSFATTATITDDVFSDPGPRLISYDFGAADAYQSVTFGRTFYLGGAMTYAYDGVGFVEAGFPYAPDWPVGAVLHTASSSGTGGMTPGTRDYVAWYEGTLANGEVIRGPVSRPYTVTVAGSDDRVVLAWPTLRIGAWGRVGGTREQARICVARTKDGDSSVYYRVTASDPGVSNLAPNGHVPNEQGADSMSMFDELSDAELVKREPLYAVDGIPSNDPIATSGVIATGKGRIFQGDSSDPRGVYFSQEQAEGYAVEFTPELRLVSPGAGPVTAVGVLDDMAILYERTAIFRTNGPGPLPNPAAGGGFASPVPVPTDTGCTSQRSIVTTANGQMFQSAQGLRLLDRGGSVGYVGAPVEAFNAQRIARATQIDGATQVRFLTDAGESLLLDTENGQWSTFTNHEGLDAVNVGGVYHYLRTDGRVFRETPGAYADDTLPVALEIETAKLKLRDAIQGLQMVWFAGVIGTWRSPHIFRMQYATDLEPEGSWSAPVDFDATSMGGVEYGADEYGDGQYDGGNPEPYEFQVHVSALCQWIAFRFTFIEAAGTTGACAELLELMLTGGVAGNLNLIPASRMG